MSALAGFSSALPPGADVAIGTLASYHNLRDFPFDKQNIVISLLSIEWPEKDVKLILDEKTTGRRD